MPTPKDKPVCHVRRHLTPSLFMTYDTMRAMSKQPEFPTKPCGIIKLYLVCYARLTTICNHNSLSRNQNRDNIAALEALGWITAEERNRFRGGRFGPNHYIVHEHEYYYHRALRHEPPYKPCPGYKYETSSGRLLTPSDGMPENFTASEYSDTEPDGDRTDTERLPETASEYSDTDGVRVVGHGPRPSISSTASEYSDTSLVLALKSKSNNQV